MLENFIFKRCELDSMIHEVNGEYQVSVTLPNKAKTIALFDKETSDFKGFIENVDNQQQLALLKSKPKNLPIKCFRGRTLK